MPVTEVSTADAIGALAKAAEIWGGSNYLTLKISYLKEFFPLEDTDKAALAEIDRMLGHSQSPMLQYCGLEVVKTRLSLFSVARRHTNIFNDHINGDFRPFLSLCNLIATPLSQSDCATFLLRGVESSLIDTARHLWVVVNLKDRFPNVWQAVERNLNPDILKCLTGAWRKVAKLKAPDLLLPLEPLGERPEAEEGRSLLIYRLSIAFLEFPSLCLFRNDLDRVVGHRLIAPLIPDITLWHGKSFDRIETLRQPDGIFQLSEHGAERLEIDPFYRTCLFLRFIQDPGNLSQLSSEDVQYIFDNTMRLRNASARTRTQNHAP